MNGEYVDMLHLELTRLCNLLCKHCYCGKAQNVTMDKDILDIVFTTFGYVSKLTLTGGEIFKVIHLLESIVELKERHNTHVYEVYIPTNGTILTTEAKNNLVKLRNSVEKMHISVSCDIYHEKAKERLPETKEELDARVSELRDFCEKNYIWFSRNYVDRPASIGRARNLEESIPSSLFFKLRNERSINPFRPVIIDSSPKAEIMVRANGNITPINCTYRDADRNKYGDIYDGITIHKVLQKQHEKISKYIEGTMK